MKRIERTARAFLATFNNDPEEVERELRALGLSLGRTPVITKRLELLKQLKNYGIEDFDGSLLEDAIILDNAKLIQEYEVCAKSKTGAKKLKCAILKDRLHSLGLQNTNPRALASRLGRLRERARFLAKKKRGRIAVGRTLNLEDLEEEVFDLEDFEEEDYDPDGFVGFAETIIEVSD